MAELKWVLSWVAWARSGRSAGVGGRRCARRGGARHGSAVRHALELCLPASNTRTVTDGRSCRDLRPLVPGSVPRGRCPSAFPLLHGAPASPSPSPLFLQGPAAPVLEVCHRPSARRASSGPAGHALVPAQHLTSARRSAAQRGAAAAQHGSARLRAKQLPRRLPGQHGAGQQQPPSLWKACRCDAARVQPLLACFTCSALCCALPAAIPCVPSKSCRLPATAPSFPACPTAPLPVALLRTTQPGTGLREVEAQPQGAACTLDAHWQPAAFIAPAHSFTD